jgi:hypothetical protein
VWGSPGDAVVGWAGNECSWRLRTFGRSMRGPCGRCAHAQRIGRHAADPSARGSGASRGDAAGAWRSSGAAQRVIGRRRVGSTRDAGADRTPGGSVPASIAHLGGRAPPPAERRARFSWSNVGAGGRFARDVRSSGGCSARVCAPTRSVGGSAIVQVRSLWVRPRPGGPTHLGTWPPIAGDVSPRTDASRDMATHRRRCVAEARRISGHSYPSPEMCRRSPTQLGTWLPIAGDVSPRTDASRDMATHRRSCVAEARRNSGHGHPSPELCRRGPTQLATWPPIAGDVSPARAWRSPAPVRRGSGLDSPRPEEDRVRPVAPPVVSRR